MLALPYQVIRPPIHITLPSLCDTSKVSGNTYWLCKNHIWDNSPNSSFLFSFNIKLFGCLRSPFQLCFDDSADPSEDFHNATQFLDGSRRGCEFPPKCAFLLSLQCQVNVAPGEPKSSVLSAVLHGIPAGPRTDAQAATNICSCDPKPVPSPRPWYPSIWLCRPLVTSVLFESYKIQTVMCKGKSQAPPKR